MQGGSYVPKQKQGLRAREDSAAPAAAAAEERPAAARAPSGKSLTALLQSRYCLLFSFFNTKQQCMCEDDLIVGRKSVSVCQGQVDSAGPYVDGCASSKIGVAEREVQNSDASSRCCCSPGEVACRSCTLQIDPYYEGRHNRRWKLLAKDMHVVCLDF